MAVKVLIPTPLQKFVVSGFHWETFQHGESELNQQQRIGGDPPLSTNGKQVGQLSLSLVSRSTIVHLFMPAPLF